MAASTFSYAQAAKGMSTPVGASKPTSGSATPAKDTTPAAAANGSTDSVPSWADEAETVSLSDQSTSTREAQPQEAGTKPVQPAQSAETPNISSPEIGASTASTVTKDDDVASLPNASSDSTWDNKSQASTSVDKSVEPVEKTSEKVKKGKNAVVKPLQEAPLPAVNIWKLRAEELKAKIPKHSPSLANGVPPGTMSAAAKKSDSDAKIRPAAGDSRPKGQNEDRTSHSRKDARVEVELKKDSKNRSYDKDAKPMSRTLPPPPNRDQAAWPTPETAIDEDRKKAQEKGEKERKESTSTGSNGKHEWVKVPYTPSVVFNTPLPNAANARRGGKPGGRGGAQTSGRSTGFGANGAGQPEKDGSAPAAVPNGDQPKREYAEGAPPRDASPRSKRNGSPVSPLLKNQIPASTVEKPLKASGLPASETEAMPRGASLPTESSQMPNQHSTFPRQYPNRSNKPRRGEFSGAGERRRDGEVSPTKDNTFDDRRTSAAAQIDAPGDSERRISAYHDGPNGHQHKQGRFGSYSGARDRGRGGSRGGRGSYANGHQYSNGHMTPLQTSTSFPIGPRSPTTFNPENPGYFPAPQGKYGRSGHRPHSVTTDPYRFPPYQSGLPVAPLQTYNMYDYNMMQQPMSAVPYTPYVDQQALFSMITTQVEYYFSVDNLLKDMFLRRRMDSQGFVFLEFIAGFNRIKHLSTDIELIKLVCQQSPVVDYLTGEDGLDRLRRKDGWEQWVLNMGDRDETAQNEGPKELHYPPAPHPNGFDQSNPPQWPMSAVAPTAPYGNDSSFPLMNGYHHGATPTTEVLPNGTASEGSNDSVPLYGHPNEGTTKA